MTDSMPDFDNMTPEQIQEWMESLAKKQGATEGFTTAASMDVPDVDPDSVDQSQFGEYIPYGWTRDQWEAQLAKEAAEKEQKKVQAPPPAPKVVAAPPPPPPAVVSAPPAATSKAAMMSQEEMTEYIMSLTFDKQMELLTELGKRERGEPNRVDDLLPKLDESTVDQSRITKYVPYGWKEEDWDAHLAKEEAAKKSQPVAATPAPIAPPPPVSIPEPEPVANFDVLKAPSLDDLFPQSTYDETDLADLAVDEEETVAASANPMDWLAGLAGDNDAPQVDLADFGQSFANLPSAPVASDDPMDWLAGLAAPTESSVPTLDLSSVSNDLFGLSDLVAPSAPATSGDVDPLEWMETLASAQGADPKELVTPANAPVIRPSSGSYDGPGYQPYSFEDANDSEQLTGIFENPSATQSGGFDDPESWLDALATGVGTGDIGSTDNVLTSFEDPLDVMRTLNSGGDVSPEAMENFFEKMFERAATEPEADNDLVVDEEVPVLQAEIPDWLQESFATGTSETEAVNASVDQMLVDLGFDDAEPISEINDFSAFAVEETENTLPEAMPLPDWLLGSTDEEDTGQITDIFADSNTIPEHILDAQAAKFAVDTTDPWVAALTDEAENEAKLKEWYDKSINKLTTTGTGPLVTTPEIATLLGILQPANLPVEEYLAQGEPMEVPAWLVGEVVEDTHPVTETPQIAVAEMPSWLQDDSADSDIPDWLRAQVDDSIAPSGDLPDWLAGSDVDISADDIPDWLRETIDEDVLVTPPPAVIAPPPASTPAFTPSSAPVVAVTPAVSKSPVVVPPSARIDVAATLQSARSKVANDVDSSLQDYEAIVRANSALSDVVGDLNKMVNDKTHKNNPAVYRVLGDALMRQGNLQDALNTYRKALNLL